jgi:hypothetical protein
VYALFRIRKEDRIEWEYRHQQYLWEQEKLKQQQNAPKRLVSLVYPCLNAIAVSLARCRLRRYLIRL